MYGNQAARNRIRLEFEDFKNSLIVENTRHHHVAETQRFISSSNKFIMGKDGGHNHPNMRQKYHNFL